uniref:Gamma-tubulin complex component n=1 Tax=Myxobolus squamalis TaxID=59785 RepID=A0A6B2FZR7_MYXSQ
MIFRHLLYIKYCSRTLSRFWQHILKLYNQTQDIISRKKYSLTMMIINKMLHFLNNFEYFIQFDVIDPNWNYFILQISKVESLEELILKNNDFLDKTLKDCMLTHSKLVEVIFLLFLYKIEFQFNH